MSPAGLKRLFLSFDGRIGRASFWFGMVTIAVVGVIGGGLASLVPGHWADVVVSLALVYPALAVATKRCHDRGRSEIVLLFVFAPALAASAVQLWLGEAANAGWTMTILGLWLVGALIWAAIDLGLMPGEASANAHGPADP